MRLEPGTVDVWYLVTTGAFHPAVLDRYRAMMSKPERQRRDRFVFAKDRDAFVVTRGFLRSVLSRYARMPPAACVFATNRFGKPSLHGAPLEFNLSHTDGLAAIAVAAGGAVGIDVEGVMRANLHHDVRRFFSAAEIRALESLPCAQQPSRFFDYWTLKEAYVKARGIGLSLPLDGFSMHVHDHRPPTIEFLPAISDDPHQWQFALVDPIPGYRMALAIRRRGADVAVRINAFDVNPPAPSGPHG
jgi:4'-phosphopantetheinyl transferase